MTITVLNFFTFLVDLAYCAACRRAAVETLGTVPIDDEGQIRPREPLGLYPHH